MSGLPLLTLLTPMQPFLLLLKTKFKDESLSQYNAKQEAWPEQKLFDLIMFFMPTIASTCLFDCTHLEYMLRCMLTSSHAAATALTQHTSIDEPLHSSMNKPNFILWPHIGWCAQLFCFNILVLWTYC